MGPKGASLVFGAHNRGVCGTSQASLCVGLLGMGGGELDVGIIDILRGYGGMSRVPGFLGGGAGFGPGHTSISDGGLHRWGLHLSSFLTKGRSAALGPVVPRFV